MKYITYHIYLHSIHKLYFKRMHTVYYIHVSCGYIVHTRVPGSYHVIFFIFFIFEKSDPWLLTINTLIELRLWASDKLHKENPTRPNGWAQTDDDSIAMITGDESSLVKLEKKGNVRVGRKTVQTVQVVQVRSGRRVPHHVWYQTTRYVSLFRLMTILMTSYSFQSWGVVRPITVWDVSNNQDK